MANSKLQVNVTVKVAWWWPLYVRSVCFFAALWLREPNMEKVRRMAERAVCCRVK